MHSQKVEKLQTRVLFQYTGTKEKVGREIEYCYSREGLNDFVEITPDSFENAQYLEVGKKLVIENFQCEIKDIYFVLYDQLNNRSNGPYNSTVVVLVERL